MASDGVELKHSKAGIEESVHDVEPKVEPTNSYSEAYVTKRGLDV
jgi:hypothetical protein